VHSVHHGDRNGGSSPLLGRTHSVPQTHTYQSLPQPPIQQTSCTFNTVAEGYSSLHAELVFLRDITTTGRVTMSSTVLRISVNRIIRQAHSPSWICSASLTIQFWFPATSQRTKDPGCIQTPLWVWQGVHWAQRLLRGHQIKGASTAHPTRTSREHPEKSAIAEHSVNSGHQIQTRYVDQIVREAIHIELHPNNMNRE
jgi:hypothetical protein